MAHKAACFEPNMDITETTVKSALCRSGIPGVDYVVNPYLGCGHGCRYCYAVFMRKHSRAHTDARWGEFVEVKTNIVSVLRAELARKRKAATAMLSSVCDPYQPAERQYRLTRGCVEALTERGWGVDILTRSPLVTRDIDRLRVCVGASVGFSIPTDDDGVRAVMEPCAPSIDARLAALKTMHEAGIRTWVFVAPMLPMDPHKLAGMIMPDADYVMADGLNYRGRVEGIFRRRGWACALAGDYAAKTAAALRRVLGDKMR